MRGFILLLLLGVCFPAWAGWYQVDAYQGTVGTYPVHFSVQKYESFGSGLNVEGSYYYDKHRAPIPLYGKVDAAGSVALCEVHSAGQYEKDLVMGSKKAYDTSKCPFQLTPTAEGLGGIWRASETRYAVKLKRTGSLDDRAARATPGTIDIPFWGQTDRHSFIGIYQWKAAGTSIKIQAINKATGRVDQIIDDPVQHDCVFGFFMTAIYMNIESGRRHDQIVLRCFSPGDQVDLLYRYDSASHRYQYMGNGRR